MRLILIFILCFLSHLALGQMVNNINMDWLKTSISVDMLYEQGLNSQSKAIDDFRLRESEIFFYADIDPKFNGVLSLNAHDEGEGTAVEIHEGYVQSSLLIAGWNLKLGQFFLDLGRLNRIHRHDWNMTSEPLLYQQFFANEGLLDKGLEVSHIFGSGKKVWELTFGGVTGQDAEHHHSEEVVVENKILSPF